MADMARKAACDHAWRRFPELAGCRPTVEERGALRIFTFRRQLSVAPGGPKVQKTVRVTVDAEGRVVKTAVSR